MGLQQSQHSSVNYIHQFYKLIKCVNTIIYLPLISCEHMQPF